MFNIGPWELGIILLVALIVVGPGKLPEVAKAIGKGINEFKKVTSGYQKDFQEAMKDLEKSVQVEDSAPEIKPGTTIEELAEKFDSVVQAPTGEEQPGSPEGKTSV